MESVMDALGPNEFGRILRMVRKRLGPGWPHLDLEQIAINAWWYSARRNYRANYRSVRWACCEALAKARCRPDLRHDRLYDRHIARDDPTAEIERSDLVERLLRRVSSPSAAECCRLYYIEGLTMQQVADRAKWPRKTTEAQVKAALREMRAVERA